MKKILIIGANRGIGLALAEEFKNHDYHVITTCRSSSEELDLLGVEVIEGISITEDQSIENLKEKVSELDCLVHNAGILRSESFLF